MRTNSDVMEELWRVKDELSSRFATFGEFFNDLVRYQSETHPEFARHETTQTLAHA